MVNSPAQPIVATFTWQPASGQTSATDPPPPAVIVEQDCTASWGANEVDGTASPSGTADCGLPGATVSSTTNSSGMVTSVTSSGTAYSSVSSPGASFSIPAQGGGQYQPSASFSISSGTSGAGNGSAGVSYHVQAFPMTISLIGTLTDSSGNPILDGNGNQQILVGQGCKASLSAVPQGCTVSSYQWSVSGTTFQDWEPSTSANSQASFYDPGPGVQTNPTYHWYWNDQMQQTETVTCTATVTPPAGQGAAFQVTATQNVTVYVPTLSGDNNQVGMGYIRTTQSGNVTETDMIALQPGNPPAGNGSIWTAAVSLPPAPTFGMGQWAYLQLIKPEEYLTVGGQQVTSKDTMNGEGLDAGFPYMGTFFTDGRPDTQGDAPKIGTLNSGVTNAVLTSSFHTYLMFQPPANSSNDIKWVPLAESLWTTNFNASLAPYDSWIDYPAGQSVGQVGLDYNFVPQNSFPSWSRIVPTGGSFQ